MKKLTIFYLAVCLLVVNPIAGQKSGFMKKVTKSANDILSKPDNTATTSTEKTRPEPSCASDQATVAMDLGGKLQIDYQELSISILNDGRILAKHIGTEDYYVSKDGVTSGPFKAGDSQIADFIPQAENEKVAADPVIKYKPYVARSGEKYVINFGGKKYGPYAVINEFKVSGSKDKFAAMATESVALTENQGKKMEEAVKNARTDQERMQLAMEYAKMMQQNMDMSKGPASLTAKLVSNIPNVSYDPMKVPNAVLNEKVKYDDILLVSYDAKIYDLQGRLLFAMKPEASGSKNLFVNSDNTKYAYYNSGTLTFSDDTKMTDLFNPHLVKSEGKVFLGYMYYSPKHNAIMLHKIPF